MLATRSLRAAGCAALLLALVAAWWPPRVAAAGGPDLVVTSVVADPTPVAPHHYTVKIAVANRGDAPAASLLPIQVGLFYSADATLTLAGAGADPQIGYPPLLVSTFDPATGQPALLPGATASTGVATYTISGAGFLYAVADFVPGVPAGRVAESDETNNSAGVPFAPGGMPDLVSTGLVAPASADVGTNIEVTWTVANLGTGPATREWRDGLVLSADQVIGDDLITYTPVEQRTVATGASYTDTKPNFFVPLTPRGPTISLRRRTRSPVTRASRSLKAMGQTTSPPPCRSPSGPPTLP